MSHDLSIRLGAASVPYAGGDETRVYALVGHPVTHSRSPEMQNAALRASGLDAIYLAIDIEPADLGGCLQRIRAESARGRLKGVNVTLPFKQQVARAMDELAAAAQLAGAVNTIEVSAEPGRGPHLRGHDTDVEGLVAALAEHDVRLAGSRLLVLGAGGMARAAVVAGLQEGAAEIRVANRTLPRAQEMLDAVCAAWHGRLPRLACAGLEDAAEVLLPDADVLVQATSLGLAPGDPSPLALRAATPALFVLDTTYGTRESALLREARARGMRGTGGLGLLLHQGAAAFRIWTGLPAPLVAMRRGLGV